MINLSVTTANSQYFSAHPLLNKAYKLNDRCASLIIIKYKMMKYCIFNMICNSNLKSLCDLPTSVLSLQGVSPYSRCRHTVTVSSSSPFPASSAPFAPRASRSKALQSLFIMPPSVCLKQVNILSGRASRFRRGIQAMVSVIILWDSYFIITLLYLSSVIDIGVVCFHCIPTHLFPDSPIPV